MLLENYRCVKSYLGRVERGSLGWPIQARFWLEWELCDSSLGKEGKAKPIPRTTKIAWPPVHNI